MPLVINGKTVVIPSPATPQKVKRGPYRNAKRAVTVNLDNDATQVFIPHLVRLLGVSRATVYTWLKAGRLPPPDYLDATGHQVWRAPTVRAVLDTFRICE
jgi:predicted DNA-binding transcriptional regulator AlpA